MKRDNKTIYITRLISNIDELAKNSRKIYLTYLVVLTFILITLFGITDLDMIKDSYQVELPIVGRNMPMGLFFIAAPILCLGIFIYMNLYFLELDQLIKLLFKRNPDFDSADLYPWLFIFSKYPRTNNYKVIGVLEIILIKFIRWWLLPIVLLFISLKYVKVHDRPLSCLLGGLTILSCVIILFLWIYTDWNKFKKIFEIKITKNASNIFKKILSILSTFIFKLLYLLLFIWLVQNYFNFFEAGMNGKRRNYFEVNAWEKVVPKKFKEPKGFENKIIDKLDNESEIKTVIQMYEDYYPHIYIDKFNEVIKKIKNDDDRNFIKEHYIYLKDINVAGLKSNTNYKDRIRVMSILFKTDYYKKQPKRNYYDSLYHSYLILLYENGYITNLNLFDKLLIVISPFLKIFERLDLSNTLNLSYKNLVEESKDENIRYWGSLNGKHLEGADFTGAYLSHMDFHNSFLRSAIFNNANLENADFGSADLRDVHFSGLKIQKVNMRGANLQRTHFNHTDMRASNLSHTKMQGARFSEVDLFGADLGASNMQGGYFYESNLQAINLTYVEMQGTFFDSVDMQIVGFVSVNMKGAYFKNSNLQGADFRRVKMQGAFFSNVNIQGSNFIDAETGKIDLINSKEVGMIINYFKNNNIDSYDLIHLMEDRSNKETGFKNCNVNDIFHSGQIQFKDLKSYNRGERWEVYRMKLLFELSKSDNNLKELLNNKLRKNYIFKDNELKALEKEGIKFND